MRSVPLSYASAGVLPLGWASFWQVATGILCVRLMTLGMRTGMGASCGECCWPPAMLVTVWWRRGWPDRGPVTGSRGVTDPDDVGRPDEVSVFLAVALAAAVTTAAGISTRARAAAARIASASTLAATAARAATTGVSVAVRATVAIA